MFCEWLKDSSVCGRDWSSGIGTPEPSMCIVELRNFHGLPVRIGVCSAFDNEELQTSCSLFIPENMFPRSHAY